jgi:predicted signal transduction protein with EAL and GGDEF domain
MTNLPFLTDVVQLGVASKRLTALKAVYHLQNQDLYSSASLGLAFYADDVLDGDTLLRYADMTMYQAK